MNNTKHEQCSHMKVNGELCQGFSITDSEFCYFHHRMRIRNENLRRALNQRRHDVTNNTGQQRVKQVPGSGGKIWFDDLSAEVFDALQLPVLEDQESVQVALNCVARAIVSQLLSPAQAKLLLYNIKLVMQNLGGMSIVPLEHKQLEPRYALEEDDPLPTISDSTPEVLGEFEQVKELVASTEETSVKEVEEGTVKEAEAEAA